MRLEKPHSLSYQVIDAHEGAVDHLGLQQVEGRAGGVVVEVHRDQRLVVGGEDALERAVGRLEDRRVDGFLGHAFLGTNLKSTSETFGVGTRIEVPSSLPLRSGMTRPIALAAPVVVGIMFSAAARAR